MSPVALNFEELFLCVPCNYLVVCNYLTAFRVMGLGGVKTFWPGISQSMLVICSFKERALGSMRLGNCWVK